MKPENEDLSSLEEPSTVVENGTPVESNQAASESLDSTDSLSSPEVAPAPSGDPQTIDASAAGSNSSGELATPAAAKVKAKSNGLSRIRHFIKRFNIYLLLFIFVILIAIVVTGLSIYAGGKSANKKVTGTQSLSSNTLKQLANSDATVGDPKQVLNVQSNAVFAGKVLIRDSLEVAGPIQVGGSLSLPGITVSGNSNFDQVQVRNTLSVGGNSSLQGQLAVQKSLSVAGGATFGGSVTAGQISANSLQINGDLILQHHIVAGGGTPSRSNGSALGSGGTSSVTGSDTAGTVSINTGGGTAAGCFATVNFTQKFNNTPRVMLTPVGSAAGGMAYYVDRTTSSFSVCTSSAAPSNQSFAFDYFIVD